MKLPLERRFSRSLTSWVLMPLLVLPPSLSAQSHVVNPTELQNELTAATAARRHNTEVLNEVLASPTAERAFQSAGLDPVKVKTAIAGMSDEELSSLAARAEAAQKDFAGGRISDRDLLIILVGIAVLILIIVAVR